MADILASPGQEAQGGAFMYGVALADSSDGKVLVRLDDDVTAPFDEEPEEAAAVALDEWDGDSVDGIDEDSDALEPGDGEAAAGDEESEPDTEGGEADEATEADDPGDDGYDELTAEGGE